MTAPAPSPNLDALALRHLRFGFAGLALFAGLGLVLEALHGFKAGFYLDVASEPRRLAFRLAHAHGTLLSLAHVAFALTLGSRFAPALAVAQRASQWLVVATLLLPGGFFLGGFFIHGGDPGPGVLVVPLGALALIGAAVLTARGLGGGRAAAGAGQGAMDNLEFREIAYDSTEYDASFVLRSRVLREPLGLRPGPEERPAEAGLVHLGAFDGGVLVGCLMLEDQGEGRVKMRQVAIDFHRQRGGVGTGLVRFSEAVARRAGQREMVLHAREKAVPFYERLGYQTRGEPFVEVTLPHIAMWRSLDG
jgi:ribosomal protein S18 acetylase RimI-like enzyme